MQRLPVAVSFGARIVAQAVRVMLGLASHEQKSRALGVYNQCEFPSFGAGLPKLCRIQTAIGVRDYGVGSPSGGCQALG